MFMVFHGVSSSLFNFFTSSAFSQPGGVISPSPLSKNLGNRRALLEHVEGLEEAQQVVILQVLVRDL